MTDFLLSIKGIVDPNVSVSEAPDARKAIPEQPMVTTGDIVPPSPALDNFDGLKGISSAITVLLDDLRASGIVTNPKIKSELDKYLGDSVVTTPQRSYQDPDEPVSTTGTMLDAAPMPTDSYVIKSGDTMGKIAANNPFTLTQLIASNPQIEDPNKIEVGQQLNFPPVGVAKAGQIPASTGTQQTGLGTYGSADDMTDLEILARTIEAEARGESKEGKIAVGAVIANRATSSTYGGSIRGAILKKAQFSPWNAYTNYQKGISQAKPMLTKKMAPSEDSYEAAKKILSGNYTDSTGGAVHYLNPKVRKPNWYTAFKNQSRGTITIGRHEFGNADSSRTYDGKSKIKEQIRQTLNN